MPDDRRRRPSPFGVTAALLRRLSPLEAGAGMLAGIGFTMSLFIAGEAFRDPAAFAAAKIGIFEASLVAAAIGAGVLWRAGRVVSE